MTISIEEFRALEDGDLLKISYAIGWGFAVVYSRLKPLKTSDLNSNEIYVKEFSKLYPIHGSIQHSYILEVLVKVKDLCQDCVVQATCNKPEHSAQCSDEKGLL